MALAVQWHEYRLYGSHPPAKFPGWHQVLVNLCVSQSSPRWAPVATPKVRSIHWGRPFCVETRRRASVSMGASC